MVQIAITSDAPHFSQEHFIFGRHYLIEFEWIEREEYWVMHLYDASENPIALGLKVRTDWPIVVDEDVVFSLIAQKQNRRPSLSSLRTDFMLVANELV